MAGSETGGAWVGTGLGREDGGERERRRMGGVGAGEGRWAGLGLGREDGGGNGLGREDGGERDGRRVGGDETGEGRWRGARRELARENGGQRDGSPQASQASLQAALGQCKSSGWVVLLHASRKHVGR